MARVKANGLEFEYDSHGKESDPAVILIMGFSGQMVMWPMSFVNALVAKGFRVIRFDNRDIGLSSQLDEKGAPDIGAAMMAVMSGQKPTGAAYLLDDMAKDTVGVLDALGIAKAHIVGASMGGMIAQLVAANHGEKALSLTSIMSTTGRPGLPQPDPAVSAALVTPPASNSREDRIAQFVNMFTVIGSPGFRDSPEQLRAFAALEIDRAPYNPAAVGRQLLAILASEPRHELLKKVSCPALVLHGADDPLVLVDGGRDTAASIPGAEMVIVPGMGHDFTEALMPVFTDKVGGFLSRVEARKKVA